MDGLLIKDRTFLKKLFSIAIPTALQFLITVGVNLMDTIMVGNLGENQLSATALANQFISIEQVLCMGLGMGASVLISRYWGSKDMVSLKKALTIMIRLVAILGLFFSISCFYLPSQVMKIYTLDEELIRIGSTYFQWSVIPCFLLGFSVTIAIVMRSVGKALVPLWGSVGALVLNILFNYMFIFGHFGAPRMEVAGAAVGTMIARSFEVVVVGGYLFFFDRKIGYRIKDLFQSCRGLLKEFVRISLPVMGSDLLLALGDSALAIIMGRIGAGFVAANAITVVIQRLTTTFSQGISQAGCAMVGNTLGERKREEAQHQGEAFMLFGFLLGIVACLVINVISDFVIGCYKLTPETTEIARQLMRAISITVIFRSTNCVMTKGVFRGGGDTKVLMIADNVFLWAVSIPLGMAAGLYWNLPAFWIYFFLKIDDLIKVVWSFFRLRSGRWMKDIKGVDSGLE
jgi:putative MATE family efflux protein